MLYHITNDNYIDAVVSTSTFSHVTLSARGLNSINPLDPTDIHAMCEISPWLPKMSPKFPQNFLKIERLTQRYLFINTTLFLLRLIYWTPISGVYFLVGSNLEKKCGSFFKNSCFSGRIWPDWGNTIWVDMTWLGSIGLIIDIICKTQFPLNAFRWIKKGLVYKTY